MGSLSFLQGIFPAQGPSPSSALQVDLLPAACTRLPMQETRETQVQSLGWEDPLEEHMATHMSILAGESHGERSLEGHGLWAHKEPHTTA